MNAIIRNVLKNKRIDFSALPSYGFAERAGVFLYRAPLWEAFELLVTVKQNGTLSAEVFDTETGDPFTLFLAESAQGEFVGTVREKYEEALQKIADACCVTEIYQSESTKAAIEFVRGTFGDELEFLWEKDTESAIWRRKDNRKWYGVLMKVPRRKFGFDSDERTEVLNLRMEPDALDAILDGKSYFRGWHMNKRHWVSVLLDGSVPQKDLQRLIEESYRLAKKS